MFRLIAVLLMAASLTGCDKLSDILEAYGYTEVRPASKLFGPGTLVWVMNEDPFQAGVICTAERALGSDFKPTESATVDRALQKAAKKGVTVTADLQAIANGNIDLHTIKDVTMTFKNARILEVSDYEIANRSNLMDRRCLKAVSMRRRAGFTVTMISSALQADVTYDVKWDNAAKLDAQGKIAALQNVAAGLGLEASNVTEKSISASGIYWGIRDDQFLAYLFDPKHLQKVDRGSRFFDPEHPGVVLTDVTPPETDLTGFFGGQPAAEYEPEQE